MKNYKRIFSLICLFMVLIGFLPVFAQEEDKQCKDRCEANDFKKETGYFTTDGKCKDGFKLVEEICCCEAE